MGQRTGDLSEQSYEVISYYLFAYIVMHGGFLSAKRFRNEFNVSWKKYYMAEKLLKEKGLIKKGKGRAVRILPGAFYF